MTPTLAILHNPIVNDFNVFKPHNNNNNNNSFMQNTYNITLPSAGVLPSVYWATGLRNVSLLQRHRYCSVYWYVISCRQSGLHQAKPVCHAPVALKLRPHGALPFSIEQQQNASTSGS